MASQTKEMFSFVSVVRGHHVYTFLCTPLLCPETGSDHDKYTIMYSFMFRSRETQRNHRSFTLPSITDLVVFVMHIH